MGMPGSGKGTQAERTAATYQIPHISTGDIFRSLAQSKSPIGLEAQTHMDKGNLVPDGLVNKILWDRLGEKDTVKGFVLDGYPRTLSQAEALEAYLQSKGVPLDAALYLAVGKQELRKRLEKRLHSPSVSSDFPERGESPSSRVDDQSEVVERRLQVSESEVEALLHFYQGLGIVSIVDGEKEPDIVFAKIQESLQFHS